MENIAHEIRENRMETRTILDEFRSVEFSVNSQYPVFQFRVRDISPSGLGILVSGGSKALKYLETGQLLDMKYNPSDPEKEPKRIKTEIRHITQLNGGRFKGQYLVGLAITSSTTLLEP